MIGMAVMLNTLCGTRNADLSAVIGKRIRSTWIAGDVLCLEFEDGHMLKIWDAGQSCCESRYMTCDDDLAGYAGSTLVDIDVGNGSYRENGDDDVHEEQFLRVSTDLGTIVACTHNEHNGYYGGFSILASLTPPTASEQKEG